TSFSFLIPSCHDINVEVGRELLGLLTAHHVKIDERVSLSTSISRLVCEHRVQLSPMNVRLLISRCSSRGRELGLVSSLPTESPRHKKRLGLALMNQNFS